MSRKRRSNRLTVEQLEGRRELRETELNQQTVLIGYGQENIEWWDSLYRTVALRVALTMVREGDAEKFSVDTPNGRVVLFRELRPIVGVQYHLPMMPNASSAEELAAFAGGRTSSRRLSNLILFPFETDRKAPLTGPRVSAIDRARAAALVGTPRNESPRTRATHYPLAAAA